MRRYQTVLLTNTEKTDKLLTSYDRCHGILKSEHNSSGIKEGAFLVL